MIPRLPRIFYTLRSLWYRRYLAHRWATAPNPPGWNKEVNRARENR